MDDNKFKLIGDYIICDTIGNGTFSKVKLGIHRANKEKVAIKVIEKNFVKDKNDWDRITREIKILNFINHTNIIKINSVREDKSSFYIIMEYCSGGELFNYIVKNKRLEEEECCFFFYQIINGLESLHNNNITHRDIKPENLLLTENKILKIIDFGLSNNFTEGKFLSTPCGSPCYASPEMVEGKIYDGFKIDIWSTGIVLFAMACGYLPFEDANNEKLFLKIVECKILFPSYISCNIKDLINKMLDPDPNKRIRIHDIKSHPVYNRGKYIYNNAFKYTKTFQSNLSSRVKTSTLISPSSLYKPFIRPANIDRRNESRYNSNSPIGVKHSNNMNSINRFKNEYFKITKSSVSNDYIAGMMNYSLEKKYILTDNNKFEFRKTFNSNNKFNKTYTSNFKKNNEIERLTTYANSLGKSFIGGTSTKLNSHNYDKNILNYKPNRIRINQYNSTSRELKEKLRSVLFPNK